MAFDFGAVLKNIAPVLGDALISAVPGGPLVKSALSAIAGALGLSSSDPATVEAGIRAMTPAQAVALRKADQYFAIAQLREANRAVEELERLASSDRNSARQREMSVRDNVPRNLAYVLTLGFFGVLGTMIVFELPDSGREPILMMLSALGTAWIGSISYFFGTTAGSKTKTDIIARSAPPQH